MELRGKTAIVTGSGRGIGEGIALAFAREGANVVVNARKESGAAAVAARIKELGGNAIAVGADVSKLLEIEAMVAAAKKAFGTVDILVNNAGIESTPSLAKDLTEEQWDHVLAVNLKGPFLCCKAVIPLMIEQGRGKIINIASTAGLRMTFFGSADYTSSKHGLIGLSQHLAWELADHQINVNVICPGGVLTPLAEKSTTPEFREKMTRRLVPMGRFCTIDEIGQAAVFFASARSDIITGQVMAVDGGLLTGFGEDLRAVLRERMRVMQTGGVV